MTVRLYEAPKREQEANLTLELANRPKLPLVCGTGGKPWNWRSNSGRTFQRETQFPSEFPLDPVQILEITVFFLMRLSFLLVCFLYTRIQTIIKSRTLPPCPMNTHFRKSALAK